MQSMLLFVAGTIGSAMLCYATPYTPETLPAKIGAFTLFTSIMGVTLAPLIAIAGTHIPTVHVIDTRCTGSVEFGNLRVVYSCPRIARGL